MKRPVDEYAILQNPWWGRYVDADFESQQAEASLMLSAAYRARALRCLHDDGWTLAQIAAAAGLTRARVWKLITRDRRAPGVPPRRRKLFCASCGGALPGDCRCGVDDDDDDD
jgi:hypothetical protein